MNIIVTGSSGYVASFLIPALKKCQYNNIIGVDLVPGKYTTHVHDIGECYFWKNLDKSISYYVVNLAAARFDYDIDASMYYKLNVENTKSFLSHLKDFNIIHFLHLSSVASFDGKNIPYLNNLGCDDAYRSTKFLQESLIDSFCGNLNIKSCTLYPSAIYDSSPRVDTNIGKLQSVSRFLPFFPEIDVYKSLTYLPGLCDFIIHTLDERKCGKYITIETPVKTVSTIMREESGFVDKKIIRLPFLKYILFAISYIFLIFGKILRKDPKLLPSRVVKLFSDTSYNDLQNSFNLDVYRSFRENNS